jgi:hypothetical protein
LSFLSVFVLRVINIRNFGNVKAAATADETTFFQDGQARFADVEVVTKGSKTGSVPASTPTNVSLATRSQMQADRARRKIP